MFEFIVVWKGDTMRYVTLVSDGVTYDVMIGAANPQIGYKNTRVSSSVELTEENYWICCEDTRQWETGHISHQTKENSHAV